MCGVLSVYAYGAESASPRVDTIISIRDTMARRGPDAAGLWRGDDHRVVLAHRRLSIIDLSPGGNQPLVSADRFLAITFNGEIYNYKQLRRELADEGAAFKTATDTEVILSVYARWGIKGLKRLRGMFAFALWDERAKGLLLARDGFGIKPLYYANDGLQLVAASEFRAVRRYLGSKITPHLAGQAGYFLRGCVPGDFTPVQEIRALPAGGWLWCSRDGIREGRFFDPVALARSAENSDSEPKNNSRERPHELKQALVNTVDHHLVADVPVGLFLSAGVDSSALACLAAELKQDLLAITLGIDQYRGTPNDEVPDATALARRLGVAHQVCWLRKEGFLAEVDSVIKAMDLPSIDGANTYFVAKAAASAGLKVALSGLGGDELFGGYATFKQIPQIVRLARPFGRLPFVGVAFRRLTAPVVGRLSSPKYASLFEYGHSPSGAFFLRRGLFMPWELETAIRPVRLDDALEALRPAFGFDGRYDGLRSWRLKVGLMEMEMYMRDQLLRDSDWAGMAHSLELRVPLVDTVLFEKLLPMIARDPAVTKADIAPALGDNVRRAVERAKTGFGLPIRDWVMEYYGVRQRRLRGWGQVCFDRWCKLNDVPKAFDFQIERPRVA